MATVTRIPVNPEVLIWARTTADLDLDAAASRIGVKPERLRSYEAGEQDPTINQIRGLAAAYHRPLAAMFLPEPLTDEVRDRLPDYRRAQVQTEAPHGLFRTRLCERAANRMRYARWRTSWNFLPKR